MDYKYIEQLLDRYFDGLTSTAEEQILKIFFSQQDIPAHLEAYADIFRFAAEERAAEKLGEDFDERLMERMGMREEAPVLHVKARRISLSERLQPLGRAVAAVAIVALVGGSMHRAYVTNIIEPIERAEYADMQRNDSDADPAGQGLPQRVIDEGQKMAITVDSLGQTSQAE